MTVQGITLKNMNLAHGQTLVIDCEPPMGATVGNESAMQYAAAFAPVMLDNGVNRIPVSLSYGGGTTRARITASARGRW